MQDGIHAIWAYKKCPYKKQLVGLLAYKKQQPVEILTVRNSFLGD